MASTIDWRQQPQRRLAARMVAKAVALTVVLAAATGITLSCELLFMGEVPDSSPAAIFEQVWHFADQEYSFFDFKEIDWQLAYDDFQPQVRSDMTDEELFTLLSDMLFRLRDGHVNLRSPFDFSRNWQWFLDYPQNFDATLLERNYFEGEQQYVGPLVVYHFAAPDDIVYVRYASFASPVSEENLDYILTTFAESDGIILDLRDNGGGSISNAFRIANRLVTTATAVARERFKNGPAHNAFTPYETIAISPPPDRPAWLKPFVVLTNRSCFSATNLFLTLVRDLEQVHVVGDWTGGGGGIPTFTELTNGWYLRVSAHQYHTLDEFVPGITNVEDGLPPDERVDLDEVLSQGPTGIDTILEAALTYVRSQ